MNDTLGDRMKQYEKAYPTRFLPLLPVCARMDGKAFHSFTRGLEKPYDKGLSGLFGRVTSSLMGWTGACIGYTQSDEISLVFYSPDPKSQIFFDGKIMKMVSVLASMVTEDFNQKRPEYLKAKRHTPAYFDCRAWQVPTLEEAANYLIWREQDATRNSILSAAQTVMSHKEMQGLNTSQLQERLWQKGINWNDYPAFFKRGTYFQRREIRGKFSADELESLPPKHMARKNPDLEVVRHKISAIYMPPFSKVVNRVEVMFNGANPEVGTDC